LVDIFLERYFRLGDKDSFHFILRGVRKRVWGRDRVGKRGLLIEELCDFDEFGVEINAFIPNSSIKFQELFCIFICGFLGRGGFLVFLFIGVDERGLSIEMKDFADDIWYLK
jgi:hypothetical protein